MLTGADVGLWLGCMLDVIDCGLLLADADGQVHYLNPAARLDLDGKHPLRLAPRLDARWPSDRPPLQAALADSRSGRRRLLTLGHGTQRVSVSLVPLPACATGTASDGSPAGPWTLLVLGQRLAGAQHSVQAFARSMQLTPAETRVLENLCAGVRPGDVARRQGVAVSTVRTQIGSIRAKTGAASIRALVRQVAVLPRLVGAARPPAGESDATC